MEILQNELNNNSELLNSKVKITESTLNNGSTNDVKIARSLKWSDNFWRTLEIPSINSDISLVLTWSANCVLSSATGGTKFALTDTKLYVLVAPLSTQLHTKLLSIESNNRDTEPIFKLRNWSKFSRSK